MTRVTAHLRVGVALTRQTVRLHLEVGDVVAAAVAFCSNSLLPGAHGEGTSLGVDLL